MNLSTQLEILIALVGLLAAVVLATLAAGGTDGTHPDAHRDARDLIDSRV